MQEDLGEKRNKKDYFSQKMCSGKKMYSGVFFCLCPRYFRVFSYTLNNNIDQLNLEINILYSKHLWLF